LKTSKPYIMKKILVPIDFSASSRAAEEYAASLAKIVSAEISLLHVYLELIPAAIGPEPWIYTETEQHEKYRQMVAKEVKFIKENYGIDVHGELEIGYTGDTISSIAKQLNADLIIMGMKGENRNKIWGSATLKTIRKTEIPILVIPEYYSFTPIKNIVLAVDFTEMVTGYSFKLMFQFIEQFDAVLQVLHIDHKGADLKVSELPEKIQLGLALSRTSYIYERVESDDIEKGILHFIENHPTDLLVMMAHHHTIFERITGNIYTDDLSFEVNIPLLILKNIKE
jgi:nucleotide-binding universal stress UspA family protein